MTDWHRQTPNFTCAIDCDRVKISDTQFKRRSALELFHAHHFADHRKPHQTQQPVPSLSNHPGPQVFPRTVPGVALPAEKETSKTSLTLAGGYWRGLFPHIYNYYRFRHASRWWYPRPTLTRGSTTLLLLPILLPCSLAPLLHHAAQSVPTVCTQYRYGTGEGKSTVASWAVIVVHDSHSSPRLIEHLPNSRLLPGLTARRSLSLLFNAKNRLPA